MLEISFVNYLLALFFVMLLKEDLCLERNYLTQKKHLNIGSKYFRHSTILESSFVEKKSFIVRWLKNN